METYERRYRDTLLLYNELSKAIEQSVIRIGSIETGVIFDNYSIRPKYVWADFNMLCRKSIFKAELLISELYNLSFVNNSLN